jgi:acyl-CoA dehydrogenase
MKNCLTKKIIFSLAIFIATGFLYASQHIFFANLLLILLVIFATPLRAYLISKSIMQLINFLNLAPKISNTEKIALTSGTVWVDGELFSGKPNFAKIWQESYPTLTFEEQNFLDNQVNKVCEMCNDYQVQQLKDLPQEVWQFLKQEKFFGMIIPKNYGGLGFSAFAHSCVIEKLASRSVCLAITVMVPNSLGPAELLLHYGTKQQQDNYLPKLACGQELPCFALTEPNAGSDATSIVSNGILFTDSNGEIKIRLNWNKRYITLGAYATLIGVAFQLKDPEKLLFPQEDVGITCALIPVSN